MSKHTPGPWGQFRGWIVTVNADGSIPTNSRIVADEQGFVRDEDRRLACAAPDLLAALKAGVDNELSMTAWLEMARAAIARAEGRS